MPSTRLYCATSLSSWDLMAANMAAKKRGVVLISGNGSNLQVCSALKDKLCMRAYEDKRPDADGYMLFSLWCSITRSEDTTYPSHLATSYGEIAFLFLLVRPDPAG
jgi:hypothetical protein